MFSYPRSYSSIVSFESSKCIEFN